MTWLWIAEEIWRGFESPKKYDVALNRRRTVSGFESPKKYVEAYDDGTASRPEMRSLVLVVWQRRVVPGKNTQRSWHMAAKGWAERRWKMCKNNGSGFKTVISLYPETFVKFNYGRKIKNS